jgi:hypothetical protein
MRADHNAVLRIGAITLTEAVSALADEIKAGARNAAAAASKASFFIACSS